MPSLLSFARPFTKFWKSALCDVMKGSATERCRVGLVFFFVSYCLCYSTYSTFSSDDGTAPYCNPSAVRGKSVSFEMMKLDKILQWAIIFHRHEHTPALDFLSVRAPSKEQSGLGRVYCRGPKKNDAVPYRIPHKRPRKANATEIPTKTYTKNTRF